MPKNRVVLFTECNAHVLKNIDLRRMEELREMGQLIIDPLRVPHALQPHYWKVLPNGEIGEMTKEERKIRDEVLEKLHPKLTGIDSLVRKESSKPEASFKIKVWHISLLFGALAVLAYLIHEGWGIK